jgi:hypothetical protein
MPAMTLKSAIALVFVAAVATSGAILDATRQAQDSDAMRAVDAPPNAVWLDSLDLTKMVQRRQTPRAGRTLAGEYVGLEEVDDGLWDVYFGPVKLGRMDERRLQIEDHKGRWARKRLSPMSPD